MFCPKCGKERNKEEMLYCENCGYKFDTEKLDSHGTSEKSEANNSFKINRPLKKGYAKKSYIATIISAVLCFFIRIFAQETNYSYESIFKNRKVLGIDSDLKPFLTVIPIIALIIALIAIVSDKQTEPTKKGVMIIVNAIFILLSIIFIWFDIPFSIVDF